MSGGALAESRDARNGIVLALLLAAVPGCSRTIQPCAGEPGAVRVALLPMERDTADVPGATTRAVEQQLRLAICGHNRMSLVSPVVTRSEQTPHVLIAATLARRDEEVLVVLRAFDVQSGVVLHAAGSRGAGGFPRDSAVQLTRRFVDSLVTILPAPQ